MSKVKKGLKRDTIDKFYTKEHIAEECVNLVKNNVDIGNGLVIEPSAGNGSFIKSIKDLTDDCLFYDLEPENEEIIRKDFLEFDFDEIRKLYDKIHIVGNPPFGRQSSMAIKFIKKCCQFASSISFILPKSFKKESMKKYFSNNYHLVCEMDLVENSFLVDDVETDVPCVFQIWIWKKEKRKPKIREKPIGFEFVKKENNPDISFRRVGVYAGKISEEVEDKSIQSHYFIKFTNGKTVEENMRKLEKIRFEKDNTVDPRSISKPELIERFNVILRD
jgi:predicted RNA methylase